MGIIHVTAKVRKDIDEKAEPILGVTALENAGIIVDPRTQELKQLAAIPLK